jgi:hypothetical protein
MYKLIQEGRNQERKKIARDLWGSGVGIKKIEEITGLSKEKIKQLVIDKTKLA